MASEFLNILDQIGIDPAELEWSQLAACKGIELNNFFEHYEAKDKRIAKQIDALCADCPVVKECFEFGKNTKSTGVFGGFYLVNGEPNKKQNQHKTPEIATKLAKRIYE